MTCLLSSPDAIELTCHLRLDSCCDHVSARPARTAAHHDTGPQGHRLRLRTCAYACSIYQSGPALRLLSVPGKRGIYLLSIYTYSPSLLESPATRGSASPKLRLPLSRSISQFGPFFGIPAHLPLCKPFAGSNRSSVSVLANPVHTSRILNAVPRFSVQPHTLSAHTRSRPWLSSSILISHRELIPFILLFISQNPPSHRTQTP